MLWETSRGRGNPPNNYKFSGQEFQPEFDLNLYDFGARQYDPATCRWFMQDPLQELTPNLAPYKYGFNNPIRFFDKFGLYEDERYGGDDWITFDHNGNEIKRIKDEESMGNDHLTFLDKDGNVEFTQEGHYYSGLEIPGEKIIEPISRSDYDEFSDHVEDNIKDFTHDVFGSSEKALDGNYNDHMPPKLIRMGLILFPPSAYADSWAKFTTGHDMYGREVGELDQWVSVIDMVNPITPDYIEDSFTYKCWDWGNKFKDCINEYWEH